MHYNLISIYATTTISRGLWRYIYNTLYTVINIVSNTETFMCVISRFMCGVSCVGGERGYIVYNAIEVLRDVSLCAAVLHCGNALLSHTRIILYFSSAVRLINPLKICVKFIIKREATYKSWNNFFFLMYSTKKLLFAKKYIYNRCFFVPPPPPPCLPARGGGVSLGVGLYEQYLWRARLPGRYTI